MFGCCGCTQEKFITEEGNVDQARLDKILTNLRVEGWSEHEVSQVQECNCDCHKDGAICLC